MLATADTSTTENTHQEIKPSLKDSGQKVVEESKVTTCCYRVKKDKNSQANSAKDFHRGYRLEEVCIY